jgi:hypothetical protein
MGKDLGTSGHDGIVQANTQAACALPHQQPGFVQSFARVSYA